MPEPSVSATEQQRDLATRWGGKPVLFENGFLAVPNTFLRYVGKLNPPLNPAEILFILELMTFKWGERAPFPGYKTLADRMGISQPYARKLARSLEDKNYLKRRIRRGQTNRFFLTGLFDELERLVIERRGTAGDEEEGDENE
jgi:DNA-binding MarR family transcriptional regulator